MPADPVQAFINRWTASGGGELANYQSFLIELCDLQAVDRAWYDARQDIAMRLKSLHRNPTQPMR